MPRSCSSSGLPVAALLAAVLVGCGTLSVPEERALGEQVNQQVRTEVVLLRDPVVERYVRDIGTRLADASGEQPFTFRFYVVDSGEINAFALPGGYIYVNSGILLRAKNVSEVAGVMGHEVGHVVKRHVAQNYKRSQTVGLAHRVGVYTAAILGGGMAASAANLGGGLAGAAYLNSYGRDAERESDQFAVAMLPRAGFDPSGLVTFFETLMHEQGGEAGLAFLSSHPATEERIEKTQAAIAAENLPPGLERHDGGKLEIIQRRIRLLRSASAK